LLLEYTPDRTSIRTCQPVLSINCHFSKYFQKINSKSIKRLSVQTPQKFLQSQKVQNIHINEVQKQQAQIQFLNADMYTIFTMHWPFNQYTVEWGNTGIGG
jgi:hypothetical protein